MGLSNFRRQRVEDLQWLRNEFESSGAHVGRKAPKKKFFFRRAPTLFWSAYTFLVSTILVSFLLPALLLTVPPRHPQCPVESAPLPTSKLQLKDSLGPNATRELQRSFKHIGRPGKRVPEWESGKPESTGNSIRHKPANTCIEI